MEKENINEAINEALAKATTKPLKIKNRYLRELGNWLVGMSLAGNDSRQRTRFIELIYPRIKEIEEELKAVDKEVKDKAKKDGKGELVRLNERQKVGADGKVVMDKDGKPVMEWDLDISPEDLQKINDDLEKYMDEEFVIDVLDSNKEKVRIVKQIILNTDHKFTGRDAIIYNQWCEAFEAVEI